MKTITITKFQQLVNDEICSDSSQYSTVIRFLLEDFVGTPGEYVKTNVEPVLIYEDCDNLFIPQIQLYVNLKKSSILAFACVCDIFFSKGAITALATALGLMDKCIFLLNTKDICIFSKLLYYDRYMTGISERELQKNFPDYCFKNNHKCPYCTIHGKCNMDTAKLHLRLVHMEKQKLVSCSDGKYHILL